jgi:hypothetical protein
MTDPWNHFLTRWTNAGIIDAATAARIRAFENEHAGSRRLRWPAWLALGFGALMVGAGILLFVSSHWDEVSPAVRFGLVLAMIASLHVGGAFAAERVPVLSSALHATGTIALGAGIYLAAQIFNLHEHWPAGLMWWAAGAGIGWALLRDPQQLALFAIITPMWLAGEWLKLTAFDYYNQERVIACGLFLMALAYFTAPMATNGAPSPERRRLLWIGGLSLVPCAITMAFMTSWRPGSGSLPFIPPALSTIGWTVAFSVPILVALILQRLAVWRFLAAVLWVGVLVYLGSLGTNVWPRYAWWALGAVGLVAWGVETARTERINVGAAALAVTIITFYFSEVMDKFGRSASLIGLGLLSIAGGWALERARRGLIRHVRGSAS